MHPHEPPRVIYVEQKRQGATVWTAKALFWIALLGVGIPMLLCILGCAGLWVYGVSTSGDVGTP